MIGKVDATRALEDAGWRADRRVLIDSDVSALENDGYETWPEAEDFLREFSRLIVSFQRRGKQDTVWFDAAKAAALSWKDWVDDYSGRAGLRLLPVGFAHRDHLLVMLGEDGRFFGGYDDYFAELGTDPIDLVQGLLDERPAVG